MFWAKRRSLLGAATLSLCCAVSLAHAQDAPSPQEPPGVVVSIPDGVSVPGMNKAQLERLEFALRGYEYFPSRAELDQIAPAATVSKALRGFAKNLQASPMIRTRAVDALGYYRDADTVVYLRGLALSPLSDGLSKAEHRVALSVKHHAIMSFAKSAGQASLGDLSALAAPGHDMQLRLTAIHAIAKNLGAPGKVVLEELAASDGDKVIQRELRKFVR